MMELMVKSAVRSREEKSFEARKVIFYNRCSPFINGNTAAQPHYAVGLALDQYPCYQHGSWTARGYVSRPWTAFHLSQDVPCSRLD